MSEVVIRPEMHGDVASIREINVAAFLDHPVSQQTEHLIVDALREAGALHLSLVAVVGERAVGHVAFSEASVGQSDSGWFLLGPVAVLPEFQSRGIGSLLVQAGLERLRAEGARGCVLVGDPHFYGRFDFASHPGLVYPGVPDEYVLGLSFSDVVPQGEVHAHTAFLVQAG